MKCHEAEAHILNHNITEAVKAHIDNCPSCQVYVSLLEHTPTESFYHSATRSVVDIGLKRKKIKHALSYFLFLTTAITLLSSAYLKLDIQTLIHLQIAFCSLMPFVVLGAAIKSKGVIDGQ